MGLPRSTFYDAPSAAVDDAEIVGRMRAICGEFETYGYRRVGAALDTPVHPASPCAHGEIAHPTDISASTPTTAANRTGPETAGSKTEAGAAIAADPNLKETGNASTQNIRCICQPRMDLLR